MRTVRNAPICLFLLCMQAELSPWWQVAEGYVVYNKEGKLVDSSFRSGRFTLPHPLICTPSPVRAAGAACNPNHRIDLECGNGVVVQCKYERGLFDSGAE